jgi:hypothetical protein
VEIMLPIGARLCCPSTTRGKAGPVRLIDAVWALNSPEGYDRLVRRRGWTPAAYEA